LLSSGSIPIAIPASIAAGSYSGAIKVTNSNGCNSPTVSFGITVNQTPVIANQTPSAICSSGSVTLSSANFTGSNTIPTNTTYTWAAPVASGITGLASGSSQSSFTTGTLTNTTSQPVTVVYSVTPTSPAACPGIPFTVTVTVNPTVILSTVPANATLCPQPFTPLSTTFSVTAANATVFQWQQNTGSGWVNLSNNSNYSGVTTSTLTVNNISETMEGYQYRTSLSNPSYCYSNYSAAATLYITNVWKGTTSTDWSTASNWWGNVVPDINCQYVIIPTVTTNLYPILKGTETEEVRNIVIRQNASVTVTQSSTLQVRGAIYSNIANYQYGTLDGTDGRIELTGGSAHTYSGTDTAQIIAGSLFKIRTLKDLKISNPLGATVQSTANDTLNITGTLSFGNVNSTILHTGDNITLVSNALGTARVADITNNGSNSGNGFDGKAIVERYFPAVKSWRFLAIPTQPGQLIHDAWQEGQPANTTSIYGRGTQITNNVAPTAANGFDVYSANPSVKWYNPFNNSWVGITSTLAAFEPAKGGYLTFIRGDRTVTSLYQASNETVLRTKGYLYHDDQPAVTIYANLFTPVNNPYASAIDLRKIDFGGSNVLAPSYIVYDPKLATGTVYGYGAFQTLTLISGQYYAIPGGGSYPSYPNPSNYIESGQSFFAQAGQTQKSIVLKETTKGQGSGRIVARQASGLIHKLLRTNLLVVSAGTSPLLVDGVLNEFDNHFNPKIDSLDIRKMTNMSENLAIESGGSLLAVERRPEPKEDTIFLNLTHPRVSTYQLEFLPLGLAKPGLTAYLQDNYLKTKTPITLNSNSQYTFQIENIPGSYAPDRFYIVFHEEPHALAITLNTRTEGKNVKIGWDVTNGEKLRQFEVERSQNGIDYKEQFLLNALKKPSYSVIDEGLSAGYYYYRIKTIDNEGNVEYSEAEKVQIANETSLITIYPNPIVNGLINIQFVNQQPGQYRIRLMNHTGQTIISRETQITAENYTETLKWNYLLAHGVYQLEIVKPDGTIKIIKVVY
jgi:hypothetical protein